MSIRIICVEFVHDHVGAPLWCQDSNRHAQNESALAGKRVMRNAKNAIGDDAERTASLKEMCEGVRVAPAKTVADEVSGVVGKQRMIVRGQT